MSEVTPYCHKDYVIFQVKAEEKSEFWQAGDLSLIRVVDRYDWKNKTNEGEVISVPKKLTDEVKITPMSYKNPIGRPEPVRKVSGKWFRDRINNYKKSVSQMHEHSNDHFHHLVKEWTEKVYDMASYSATDWVPEYIGQSVWDIEIKEGDKIFFASNVLDYHNKIDMGPRDKPFYKIPYDSIIGYERDGEMRTTSGHILLEPIKENIAKKMIIGDSNIVGLSGEKMKVNKEIENVVNREDEGIVKYLPSKTINGEKLPCRKGDHVRLKGSAGIPIEIQGKTYLRCKYREVLGVMKEKQ